MRIPPINVILSWPTPNYVDPINRGPALLIVNIIFVTLVVVAFIGRMYCRIHLQKWFGIDDATNIPAFVSARIDDASELC